MRITEPFSSNVLRFPSNPAEMVSFALSLEYSPVVSTENAKTDETTTKAISTIAVSSPVIPRWSRQNLLREEKAAAIGAFAVNGR